MPTIPPTAFNIAFGAVEKLEYSQIDGLLPAMANDLVRATKPEQVQEYLNERAGEIRDRGPKVAKTVRLADHLEGLAEEAAIDATLFAGMVALAYGGGTRIEPAEAKALIAIKDWIIESAKSVDKKPAARKMLAEIELVAKKPDGGEGIAVHSTSVAVECT